MARFLVQWIVSERRRQSVIPLAFWYLSLGGGSMLLCYAIYRRDPVFILGQSTGVVIYGRNLMLLRRAQQKKTSTSLAHPHFARKLPRKETTTEGAAHAVTR